MAGRGGFVFGVHTKKCLSPFCCFYTQYMPTSLKHKIAVVTGASSGLGKGVVEQLNAAGVKTIALARSIEKTDLPDSVRKVAINIRDLQSIDDAFKVIDEHTDHIDIL